MRSGISALHKPLNLLRFLGLGLALTLVPTLAHAIPVEPEALKAAIESRRLSVPEFQKIAEEAGKRGLRVFLAGGLAASYGDFAKHQLLSETQKMEIPATRLRPELYNIALPAQDLDLVITRADGTAETADEIAAFQKWLNKKIPETYGKKSRWDVNGLRTAVNQRPAWEGDPDFVRQNNDSLSLGLIELTEPPNGSAVISEAAHLAKSSNDSLFLHDLAGDEIHFLRSSEHGATTRVANGMNPEILGAIRVLTKAFQFDKQIPFEDMRQIKSIIDGFDRSAASSDYVLNWITHRAPRMISHAYSPEKAMEFLDKIGLRQRLLDLDPQGSGPITLWFNKKALPTKTQSFTAGKTAAELGITALEHDTTPEAARMITWRYDGIPRAFISRPSTPGETARFGQGLYLKPVGEKGWTEHETHVVMIPDPEAREGLDFDIIEAGGKTGYRWHGSSTLRLTPESMGDPAYASCTQRFEELANATSANPTLATKSKRPFSVTAITNNVLSYGLLAVAPVTIGSIPLMAWRDHRLLNNYIKRVEAAGSASELFGIWSEVEPSSLDYDKRMQLLSVTSKKIAKLKAPPTLEESVKFAKLGDEYGKYFRQENRKADPEVLKDSYAPLLRSLEELSAHASPTGFLEALPPDLKSLGDEKLQASLRDIITHALRDVPINSLSPKAISRLSEIAGAEGLSALTLNPPRSPDLRH